MPDFDSRSEHKAALQGSATAAPPDAVASFSLAPGFRATATACGLKPSGALDLALIASRGPCSAAGMFTTNLIQAAPVLHDREVLARNAAGIRAVIANSGCANACTGRRGMADARGMAALTARALGCDADQVLVLSTGVIGQPLDMGRLAHGIEIVTSPAAPEDPAGAVRAIMTTDTRPKTAALDTALRGGKIVLRGFAKGAGMIHPNLATMLAVVTTDARVEPSLLEATLNEATLRSFNRISVDGDMSTNDTVLLLASGESGVEVGETELDAFTEALGEVSVSLARQIVRDGEGATRLIEITVCGSVDEEHAHRVADRIACSPLVKTAIHGGDPNWGRILAAAGASGVPIEPDRLTLTLGDHTGSVCVVSEGLPTTDSDRAAEYLGSDPVLVRLDLGLGQAQATVWTCDLSAEYVAINADYTT